MKKIITFLVCFLTLTLSAQVSNNRVKTYWSNRVVPIAQYIDSTFNSFFKIIPTSVKTGTYAANANDFIPIDLTGGSFTLTLPTTTNVVDGVRIGYKIIATAGSNSVLIKASGSDVFNKTAGSTTLTILLNNQSQVLQYKASSGIWYVLADNLALSTLDARYAAASGSTVYVPYRNQTDTVVLGSKSIITPTVWGSSAANGTLVLRSTTSPTVGVIQIGAGTGTVNVKDTTIFSKGINVTGSVEANNLWYNGGNTVNSNTASIGALDNRSVYFKTNNINQMKLDSLGRVGIGTNSPTSTLQVIGTLSVSSTSTLQNLYVPGTYTGNGVTTFCVSSLPRLTIDGSGYVYARGVSQAAENNAIGLNAMPTSTAIRNSAYGDYSNNGLIAGSNNSSFGRASAFSPTAQLQNSIFGASALFSATDATNCVVIGFQAAVNSTSLNQGTIIGAAAAAAVTGSANTIIGYNCASALTIGVKNTYIGANISVTATANNNIILADGAGNKVYRWDGNTNTFSTSVTSTSLFATASILSSGQTQGIGYATGSGSTVTQGTNRTTGVTINAINGAITLVSAAGLATYQTFQVTNNTVAATDVIIVNQKSGTDLYIMSVTNVAAGSFKISFATTGGTTTEQPVFNFAVIKAVSN